MGLSPQSGINGEMTTIGLLSKLFRDYGRIDRRERLREVLLL